MNNEPFSDIQIPHNLSYFGPPLFSFCVIAACTKPKLTSSTYSTESVLFSTESVFIAEVDVDCGGDVCIVLIYSMYDTLHL